MLAVIVAGSLTGIFFILLRDLLVRAGCTRGKWTIKPLSSALVLCGGVMLSAMTVPLMLSDGAFLLAPVIGFGVVLSMLDPIFAVGFFLSNLLIRPWELIELNAVTAALPKALAGLTLFSWILNRIIANRIEIGWNRACTLFACLLGWWVFVCLVHANPVDGLMFLFNGFFPITVTVLLIFNCVRTLEHLSAISLVLVVSVGAAILAALYISYAQPTKVADGRLESLGLFGNANDLAALIALAFPILVFEMLVRPASALKRSGGVLIAAIFLAGVWRSQSRGAILSLVAAAVTYGLTCIRLNRKQVALIAVFVVLMFGAWQLIQSERDDLAGSTTSRWNYVIAGLRMMKDYPIWGVGLSQYPYRYEQYTPSFDEWGSRTAHSVWILVMSESGFVGLAIFVALVGVVGRAAWRIRRQRPEFLLALMSYGISMTFLSHTYIFTPYVLFAMVVAARGAVERDAHAPIVLPAGGRA
jgi:O-antigen ligase